MAELELSLAKYNKKRDFTKTHEPKGKLNRRSKEKKIKSFVVQKHDASRLHYDIRIESESGSTYFVGGAQRTIDGSKLQAFSN